MWTFKLNKKPQNSHHFNHSRETKILPFQFNIGSIDFSRCTCKYMHTQNLFLSGLLLNLGFCVKKKKKWCLYLSILSNRSPYRNKNIDLFLKPNLIVSVRFWNNIKGRSNTCFMKQCMNDHHTASDRGWEKSPWHHYTIRDSPNSPWISYRSSN